MHVTSTLAMATAMLAGIAAAMPSANNGDGNVEARSPLYGPRPIRISDPDQKRDAAPQLEVRNPLYGPRPIRISDPDQKRDASPEVEARSPLYGPRPIRISDPEQ